ncbi:MAG UNVERIFIED_CONTAM: hypothetical protein LVR18_36770 [Planctomycetaceae bacterium]
MILLSIVQSRLRGDYEEMLQQAVNARTAAEMWRSESRQELKRLEQAAEQWAADNARRRESRSAGVADDSCDDNFKVGVRSPIRGQRRGLHAAARLQRDRRPRRRRGHGDRPLAPV